MLLTSEILQRTGLKASLTLKRWAKAGLIPSAKLGLHPNGRGKTSFWPDETLELVGRILVLKAEGKTLAEISVVLSSTPSIGEKHKIRRYNFQRAMLHIQEVTRQENFVDAVAELCRSALPFKRGTPVRMQSVYRELESPSFITKARHLAHSEERPMLVFNDQQVKLLTAAKLCEIDRPYVVVPLTDAVRSIWPTSPSDDQTCQPRANWRGRNAAGKATT